MKKISLITLLISLCTFIIYADYPESSYELNTDGRSLMKWTGPEKVIDMNSDDVLKDIIKINNAAFRDNQHLESIVIGEKVTHIGTGAFLNCKKLTNVILPEGLLVLPNQGFRWSGITDLKIPDSVIEIGEYAFWACTDLKEIELGTSIDRIGRGAFRGTSIQNLVLPSSVDAIDNGAFFGMKHLQTFKVKATNPPRLLKNTDGNHKFEEMVFEGINFKRVELHVPQGSVEKYKNTDQWNQFQIVYEM